VPAKRAEGAGRRPGPGGALCAPPCGGALCAPELGGALCAPEPEGTHRKVAACTLRATLLEVFVSTLRPLVDVAAELGIPAEAVLPWGRHAAKIDPEKVPLREGNPTGKVVLVSAMTATPAGEGKTTTSIGLAQGLRKAGHRCALVLREPSLGPVFGVKGGGTGGGVSRIEPHVDINLHFTGDMAAICAAHNLLAAAVGDAVHFGRPGAPDARHVRWKRIIDVGDRALRNIVVGVGGEGVAQSTGFDITAASEVMACLCMATDADDLRARLDRMWVGLDSNRKPVEAKAIGVTGAMMALLRDALLPNLVQTTEGGPCIVHGGPFANIAHGCNSIIATHLGQRVGDVVVTEAGFDFALGGQKFLSLKCPEAGIDALAAVVVVCTIRALRHHGHGKPGEADLDAVKTGIANLDAHLDAVLEHGQRPVVAINRFPDDAPEELAFVKAHCEARGVVCAESDHFANGGEGSLPLVKALEPYLELEPAPIQQLSAADATLKERVHAMATKVYGADGVEWSGLAERKAKALGRLGVGTLPVCMAKTQASLSDDKTVRNRPTGWKLTVRDLQVSPGAGFVVVLAGTMVRMPAMPRRPKAMSIDLLPDGTIVGVE